ncbi:hypothetical protein F5879DRAFT_1022955 [Lentinula edodes]|nr:hypothetical protein F5879DRAFT_1022955 [Lentinula edodes]
MLFLEVRSPSAHRGIKIVVCPFDFPSPLLQFSNPRNSSSFSRIGQLSTIFSLLCLHPCYMAESSLFVFDVNPQGESIISPEEVARVHELFASFDTAWDHPAIQSRLKQARRQSDSSSSPLNSMTLFAAIWSSSTPPEFHKYQVVWKAMRMQLENDGVLAKLVSEFNAYVKRQGKARRRGSEIAESLGQRDTEAPQSIGNSISSAWMQRRQAQLRTKGTRSSADPSSDKVFESKFRVRERPPPAPVSSFDQDSTGSSYVSFPFRGMYEDRDLDYEEEQSRDSSFDLHSNISNFQFLSYESGAASTSTQSYPVTGHQQTLAPTFSDAQSYLYSTNTIQQQHEQPLGFFSPFSTNDFAPVFPETNQSAANFRVAPGPSNLAPSQYATLPQSGSYPTQAYQIASSPSPRTTPSSSYPFSSSSSSSSFDPAMSSYNSSFDQPPNNYLGGNPHLDFGSDFKNDAFGRMLNGQGSGFGYSRLPVHPTGTMSYASDYSPGHNIPHANWSVGEIAADASYTDSDDFCGSFGAGSLDDGGSYRRY